MVGIARQWLYMISRHLHCNALQEARSRHRRHQRQKSFILSVLLFEAKPNSISETRKLTLSREALRRAFFGAIWPCVTSSAAISSLRQLKAFCQIQAKEQGHLLQRPKCMFVDHTQHEWSVTWTLLSRSHVKFQDHSWNVCTSCPKVTPCLTHREAKPRNSEKFCRLHRADLWQGD